MPENQLPPTWGPAYDERDLDALLDGDLANLPEALLPLAGTLTALHARPVQAELAGEAAARAAFRHFAHDARVPALGAQHGTVPHTLVLPRRPEDRPQRHTPRHRRRRAVGGARRPMTIVVGAAAAVVVVAGAALAVTGLLPGPFRQLSHFGHVSTNPSAVATGTAQVSPTSGLESGSSAKDPDVLRPTSSGTATSGELCRQYYAFFDRPEPKSAWAEELTVWRKLDKLAGGPWKVFSYCLPDMDYGSWVSHATMQTPPQGNYPGPPGNAGNSGNGTGGKGSSTGNGSTSGAGTGSGHSAGSAPTPGPSSLSTPSEQATPGRPGHSHLIDPKSATSGLSR